MPTFAFPNAPERLAADLRFGSVLDTRLLSTPGRSTSELLRTL